VIPTDLHNCAVRERTGDGVSVGRCWCYVGDKDVCPRHGDVKAVMEHYRKTGSLSEDPRVKGGFVLKGKS